MSGEKDSGGIWIVSTRDPDDEPVCQVTWGPLQWYATVDDVREAAADLVTCAAYAEMMKVLITEGGLKPRLVQHFTELILRGREKRFFGAPTMMELQPAGARNGAGDRLAVVLLRRGSMQEGLQPDEARAAALGWLQVAEGTESDQLVSEALRATGVPEDTAGKVFGYLRQLRSPGYREAD
jgi:hypothetical protein